MRTIKRKVSKVDSETKRREASVRAMKLIVEQAKILAQASGLRLELAKREKAAKAEITSLLEAADLSTIVVPFELGGQTVTLNIDTVTPTTTVVDIEKLTKLLTPKQLRSCSTVTLKAAGEVLPKALVDQCSSLVTRDPVAKITFSKGCPIPLVRYLT